MADENEVVFRFTAEDGITEPMEKAQQSIEETTKAAERNTEAQEQAQQAIEETTEAADRNMTAQEKAVLKSVSTMQALQSIQSGLSAVTSAVGTLGLVDDETAKSLQKVVAGIQMVVGTAQAVKGVAQLFEGLNGVLKTTAIVSTFASIAENPAVGIAVVQGAGLQAGAVAGYLLSATGGGGGSSGGGNQTAVVNATSTTNIQVRSTEQARQTSAVLEAGAWY